jgi:hypothetical protein
MAGPRPPSLAKRVQARTELRQAASADDAFYLVAGLGAYGLAFTLLILLHPFSERVFVTTSDAAGILPPAFAAALAFVAARASVDHVRTGWRYIAAGCLAWTLGESAWLVYEVILGQDPFPSLADVGYLAMLPLVAVGLVYLTSEGRRLLRCQPPLEGVALTLALASMVWFFALQPTYADSASSVLEKAIGAAYPIGDLALCFALAVAVQRRWARPDTLVLVSLLAGMLLLVAADVGFAYQSLEETYTSTSLVNLGWPLGFLAIAGAAGLSAIWSPAYATDQALSPPRPWRIAFPLVLLAPQLAVVVWSFREESATSTMPIAVMTAVTAMAVAVSVAISFGLVREIESSRRQVIVWLDDFIRRRAA